MNYASATELIQDYLPEHTGNAAVEALIGRLCEAASRLVDRFCIRRDDYFAPAAPTATEREFIGQGKVYLILPVHVKGTVTLPNVDAALYYEADNGWIYTKPLPDYLYIPMRGYGDEPLEYYDGRARFVRGAGYKVSARWGYADTPADVKEAVRQTVIAIFERKRGILNDVTTADLTLPVLQLPPVVRDMLLPYKRREFEIE